MIKFLQQYKNGRSIIELNQNISWIHKIKRNTLSLFMWILDQYKHMHFLFLFLHFKFNTDSYIASQIPLRRKPLRLNSGLLLRLH